MKHLLKTTLVLSIFLSLLSCSKDDESPSSNSLKADGVHFSINEANIMGISAGDGGHTVINLSGGNASGVQNLAIDIDAYTRETIPGSYSYPTMEGDKALNDWLTNYMYTDSDITNITTSNLKSGQVTITHNGGNNYTLDMNLTMVDGATFTGIYTGDFSVMFSVNN
ncbi:MULTISPECIES: hypothetical protein [unclassified Carboxylicivirga]|uniref:hypothetical protein n=1 Tax=Carboxylicivirga TaxID=1628153 RepID=UPI003D325389